MEYKCFAFCVSFYWNINALHFVLVSVVWSSESVICIHTSLPSWSSLSQPPLTSLDHHRTPCWTCAYSSSSPTIYLTHGGVYMLILISLSLHPTLPRPAPCLHVHSLCLHLSSCLENRFICTIFSRFYIYSNLTLDSTLGTRVT